MVPSLPGFVSSIDLTLSFPIGLTYLYYICFLVGFAISASVYIVLHKLFPAHATQAFVKDAPVPAVLMREYRDSWDARHEPILAPPEKGGYNIPETRKE